MSKILKEGIKIEQLIMSKLYPIVLKRIVKKELNAYYPAKLLLPILAETKKEYISILERTPAMGGSANAFINNMYLGAYLIALYKQIKDKVTIEEFRKIINQGLENFRFLKIKARKSNYFTPEALQKKKMEAEWAVENKERYPWTWQLDIPNGKKPDGLYFEFKNCGLCHLCSAEGIPELTPLMCDTDYKMLEIAGCHLERTSTLAEGADCCDFWIRPKT